MEIVESTRSVWQNNEVFDIYALGRAQTGHVLGKLVGDNVLPYIEENSRVLEIGSGNGVLYKMVENNLPPSVNWLETDQSFNAVSASFNDKPMQVTVEYPYAPFREACFEAIIGLGSMDTMRLSGLTATMIEARRVLKTHGNLIHLLDMTPNHDEVDEEASSNGYVTFPCSIENESDYPSNGVHLVKKWKLEHAIRRGMKKQEPSVKRVLLEYMRDPNNTIAYCSKTAPQILDMLAKILQEEGLVERTVCLSDHFRDNMLKAADKAGFLVTKDEFVEGQALVNRSQLPAAFPFSATSIERRFGITRYGTHKKPSELLPGMVEVSTNVLAHVLEAA